MKEFEVCELCGKRITIGNNKPNSLHKTKKIIKPNLQKYKDKIICTKCLKTATC